MQRLPRRAGATTPASNYFLNPCSTYGRSTLEVTESEVRLLNSDADDNVRITIWSRAQLQP
jgi:hypothetical protein